MKTQREKREERRQNGLREVERQIRIGSLVVRQMTAAERATYPACEPGRQREPDARRHRRTGPPDADQGPRKALSQLSDMP